MTFSGVACPTCSTKIRVEVGSSTIVVSCPNDGVLAQLNYESNASTPFGNIRKQVASAVNALRAGKPAHA